MTQSEFKALETLLNRLTLQVNDMTAKVATLQTGQSLIEQRLNSENAAAARESSLLERLTASETAMARVVASKDAELKEKDADAKAKAAEVKEAYFTFHLRVLTSLVGFLAIASFPQLYIMWKAFRP